MPIEKRRSTAQLVATACALALGACASPVEESDMAPLPEVNSVAELQQMIDEGTIGPNGLLYDADGNLQLDVEAAEEMLAAARDEAVVQKGYRVGADITDTGNILLYALTPFPEDWAVAMLLGAIEWASKAGVPYTLDANQATSVTFLLFDQLPYENLDETYLGWGEAPANGYPGIGVWINKYFDASPCGEHWTVNTVPPEYKLRATIHELGHTLGLAHPDDPNGTHVYGTGWRWQNYQSVMWNQCVGGRSTYGITNDDIKTVQALLP